MLPTRDQIERAAYDRWLRRHRAHGHDRSDWVGSEHELTYQINFETVAEYPLDPASPLIVAADVAGRCRFCERIVRHAAFSGPRAVVQGANETALYSRQVCDDCQVDCRDPLAQSCQAFWKALTGQANAHQGLPRGIDSLAVFKSLVTSALLIMPEQEVAYFTDTLEWVNNPDHEYDAGLFGGTYCHVYRAPFLNERSWVSLSRRVDDDAPFPYMVCFFSSGGVIVQISVPLSIRDHDLDGRLACLPVRSLTSGEGPHFCATGPDVLLLVEAAGRMRARGRRELAVN
jgi:hypothetical protein